MRGINKNGNKVLWACLLIWIFCAIAAVYIRLYPLWGHLWSPTNEQATMAVVFNIKKTFLDQLHQQYPQMPFEEADRAASLKLNETLRKDNAQVRLAIEKTNQQIHRQSGSNNDPIYLLEADPFYYYNLTEHITQTGRIADIIKGNKYFNPLMGAPFGYWQPLTIHPYVGFILYKIAHVFDPRFSLMAAVAFTPLLITVFILLGFIWCGKLLNLSAPAMLAGCFYLGMAPIFLKRSALGWYDTDPYNLLFPFIFLGLFIRSIADKAPRAPLITAIILALVLILYSLFWQGWVFLFFMTFICAATAAVFALLIGKDARAAGTQGIMAMTYLTVTFLIGTLIYGLGDFLSFFTEGAGELMKFTVKGMNLWPNLFIEVGELKKSSWGELIFDTGGPIFLLGAALGLIYAASSARTAIVAAFLLITVILTFKAGRFTIFTLAPLSIFFALGIDKILVRLKPYGKIYGYAVIILLLAMSWFNANKSIRTVLTPIYNSVWDEALTAAKNKTPTDSILNTWWPPGHFIKAVSHRKVVFDGASLSEGATGYWMANALLSTNENKARGIVRMLNLSGNRAVEFLTTCGMKTSNAVALLYLILGQTPAEAIKTLTPFLNGDDVRHLLLLTHGGSPHSYVLVYNELVDQNIGLVFVARRDIQKIEAINADPKMLAAVPSPDSPGFIDFLWNLSGGPSKYSEPLTLAGQNEDSLMFSEGLTIKRDMSTVSIDSPYYGKGIPGSIIFRKEGRAIEKELPNANLNYSVLFYEQDGRPVCRLMDKNLADSLIMRMFFFDGEGLQNFRLLKSSSDPTGRTQIKIFEVLWD